MTDPSYLLELESRLVACPERYAYYVHEEGLGDPEFGVWLWVVDVHLKRRSPGVRRDHLTAADWWRAAYESQAAPTTVIEWAVRIHEDDPASPRGPML